MKNPYLRKPAFKSPNTAYHLTNTYRVFIETIIQQGKVVGLYQAGWALCSTPSGQRAFALWQSKSLAQLLIKDHWAAYKIQHLDIAELVHQVIPFLCANRTMISLNLTPEGHNVLVRPEKLRLDIKNYLYQFSMQQPELFQQLQLPSPRTIRLH